MAIEAHYNCTSEYVDVKKIEGANSEPQPYKQTRCVLLHFVLSCITSSVVSNEFYSKRLSSHTPLVKCRPAYYGTSRRHCNSFREEILGASGPINILKLFSYV